MTRKIQVVFDCETQDPDDMLTLLALCDHPKVWLRAVTITPGSWAQARLVDHLLNLMGRSDVLIGSHDTGWPKDCVSGWHYTAFGTPRDITPDVKPAAQIIKNMGPSATLLTGAAPRNLGTALRQWNISLLIMERWVAQGGFAGDNVVPEELRLEKFKGRTTCPTYNFNGDPRATLLALGSPVIPVRHLVSKNVCHGVEMTSALRSAISLAATKRKSLELTAKHCPGGKMLHDLVAMTAMIDPEIFRWVEVELYRESGAWGAKPAPGSKTWISVGLDHEAFVRVLTETEAA